MTTLIKSVSIAVGICLLTASVFAHEVTYRGKVVLADKAVVKVAVVDAKTKKPVDITFKIDKETKVLRGDKVVAFADARIEKGESIAVTVDHDLDENLALVVRVDAKK
jgi:hypothetical protein